MKVAAAIAAACLISAAAHAQTAKDTHVVLDAPEKRIVREQYHDDKAVTVSGTNAGGWHLYAGAAIDAQRIDLRMRNVRGEVRFRADWSRIESVLGGTRRATFR